MPLLERRAGQGALWHLEGPPIWAAHYPNSGSPASILKVMPCGFPCRAQARCLADYVHTARDCPPPGSGLAPADHAPPCSPPDTACVESSQWWVCLDALGKGDTVSIIGEGAEADDKLVDRHLERDEFPYLAALNSERAAAGETGSRVAPHLGRCRAYLFHDHAGLPRIGTTTLTWSCESCDGLLHQGADGP